MAASVAVDAAIAAPVLWAGLRRGDVLVEYDFEPDDDGNDTVYFTHHGKHHRLRSKTEFCCDELRANHASQKLYASRVGITHLPLPVDKVP